jgi:hypothetical protein
MGRERIGWYLIDVRLAPPRIFLNSIYRSLCMEITAHNYGEHWRAVERLLDLSKTAGQMR